jgi:hypothetical protein
VDKDRQDILDHSEVYNGVYGGSDGHPERHDCKRCEATRR